MSSITAFIAWYSVVQLISLLVLPLSWRLFLHLPDRGYCFNKILGILFTGYVLWLANACGLFPNTALGAWGALLLAAACSLAAGREGLRRDAPGTYPLCSWIRTNHGIILGAELLFLVTFSLWALVRAFDPAVNHTEQPMDLMMINAIWASPSFPPHDSWLSGYPIGYYYLGYWLLATLGRLAAQPPEMAYNLGQACWYALLMLGCYGLGYNLLAPADPSNPGRASIRMFLPGALFMALCVCFSANLQGALDWLAQGKNQGTWWWWECSRVIQDADLAGRPLPVITEFPIFSYILGDNHPHLLAMPLTVLNLGLALNLFLVPTPAGGGSRQTQTSTRRTAAGRGFFQGSLTRPVPLGWLGVGITAMVLGSLISVNTWDFPACWLVMVLSFYTARKKLEGRVLPASAAWGLLLVASGLLLYTPYLFYAQSQFAGFVPNFFNPTPVSRLFMMFGPFLLALAGLIWMACRKIRPRTARVVKTLATVWALSGGFLAACVVLLFWNGPGHAWITPVFHNPHPSIYSSFMLRRWLQHPFTWLLLASMLALVAALLREHWRPWENKHRVRTEKPSPTPPLHPALPFILILALTGLVLVLVPELIYVKDNFGTRMNTVFKFYYQGWLLLGLSASWSLAVALPRRGIPFFLSGLALSLLCLSAGYSLSAIYAKTRGFSASPPTLNAMAHLQAEAPDQLAALQWIRLNTPPQAVVAEAKGRSYDTRTSRVSTFTGRPTLLGWEGHESQWRGQAFLAMAAGRARALEALYNPSSAHMLSVLLSHWNIDYVYVGPAERRLYAITPTGEALLNRVMDTVFHKGQVRIFRPRHHAGNFPRSQGLQESGLDPPLAAR